MVVHLSMHLNVFIFCCCSIMHFVNIHLFHDESNFVAMEKVELMLYSNRGFTDILCVMLQSPSCYSSYRKTALSHVMNR